MCVIFVALCCFSITCMFLCCPAKNQSGLGPVSPITPFPTTGLAANIALRTAGITAVGPTHLRPQNSTNRKIFSASGNQKENSIVINHTPIVKRNEKIARFAEKRKSKSRSIDVVSFPPCLNDKQEEINRKNIVSSLAIVEPIPSEKNKRRKGKGSNIKNKSDVCHNKASLGTMTPPSSLQARGTDPNIHNSFKSNRSLRKLKKTSSSNIHPKTLPVRCMISKGTSEVCEYIGSSTKTGKDRKPSITSSSNGILISNIENSKTEIGSSNTAITETESSTVAHLNNTKDCENENCDEIFQLSSSPIASENDTLNDATITNPNKKNHIEGITRNSPPQQKPESNKILNPSQTKQNDEYKHNMLPDMDGNSDTSLRQGLFVIYLDDTYVDV